MKQPARAGAANVDRPPARASAPSVSPNTYQRARRMTLPSGMARALAPWAAVMASVALQYPIQGPSAHTGQPLRGVRYNPHSGELITDGGIWDRAAPPFTGFTFATRVLFRTGNPWQPNWLSQNELPPGRAREHYTEVLSESQMSGGALVTYGPGFIQLPPPSSPPTQTPPRTFPGRYPQLRPGRKPRTQRPPKRTRKPRYNPNRGTGPRPRGFTLQISPNGGTKFWRNPARGRPPRNVRERKVASKAARILAELISISEIADFIEVAGEAAGIRGNVKEKAIGLFIEGKFFEMDLLDLSTGLIENVIEDQLIGRTRGALGKAGGPLGTRVVTGLS